MTANFLSRLKPHLQLKFLKPDQPDQDYAHSVINEWFVMRLAKRLGLDVPDVHRLYDPSPVYLVDRFERIKDGQHWQRRHVIDACQLLGLDRSFKYSQGNMENLAKLANACRSPEVARSRLFAWLVFSWRRFTIFLALPFTIHQHLTKRGGQTICN